MRGPWNGRESSLGVDSGEAEPDSGQAQGPLCYGHEKPLRGLKFGVA